MGDYVDGLAEFLPPLGPRHGIGGNSPPSDAALLLERLTAASVELVERTNALVEAAARVPSPIPDEDTAARCAAFCKQITAHEKAIEDKRRAEKRPYDELAKGVQAFFAPMLDHLAQAKRAANDRLLGWQREQQRKADEERRRQEAEARRKAEEAHRLEQAAQTDADLARAIAAEEEAAAAQTRAAAVGAPAPIRSDLGAVATLRRTLAYEVTSLDAVPRRFLLLNDAAIKGHMKLAQKGALPPEVPGIRFFFNESMVTR